MLTRSQVACTRVDHVLAQIEVAPPPHLKVPEIGLDTDILYIYTYIKTLKLVLPKQFNNIYIYHINIYTK
jgi:hypothetical protein